MTIRATLRLQLHRDFGFADAEARLDYFQALGISHLYLSPILAARPGSQHGYDTLDYARVNSELGGESGFRKLVTALRKRAMGAVIDIVPNHMAADTRNAWWRDVLAKGRASEFADYFDIDWNPPDPGLRNRLLLPVLGASLEEVLAKGELKRKGAALHYYEHRFPLREPRAKGDLAQLLEDQHYRLAHWRSAADSLNWRRFFEVTSLVGLRVEKPAVFEAVHAKIFELYKEGLIDGLRVDHVDGLADPRAYCLRLRRHLQGLRRGRAWVVVEKILAADETLPADWDCEGSTGYDFMAESIALLTQPRGQAPLTAAWTEWSRSRRDYAGELRHARRLMASRNFNAEVSALAQQLRKLNGAETPAHPYKLPRLRAALRELLQHFPVYRLYAEGGNEPLEQALAAAQESAAAELQPVLVWIVRCLCSPLQRHRHLRRRFSQLTPALVAKSSEDTAFYRYGRLLALNEVGNDPARFSLSNIEFHRRCKQRGERFPQALLATATHDHKRGEDLRARLAVLSELPEEWTQACGRWRKLNARHRSAAGAPDGADEYQLYQTLVGAWPLQKSEKDFFEARIAAWQEKALREAKRHSDWLEINADYEQGCRDFLHAILGDRRFTEDLDRFARRIAPAGALNGLAQTLLRLTCPGIPDLYQGMELWDYSLVDPDNRRPVDYALRERLLRKSEPLPELLKHWQDGRVKQALIQRLLALRVERPQLFAEGSYRPLRITGPLANHVLAFERRWKRESLVVVTSLRGANLLKNGTPLIARAQWQRTALALDPAAGYRSLLHEAPPGRKLDELLETFPLSLLYAHAC